MDKVLYWSTMLAASALVGGFSTSVLMAIIGGAVVGLVWAVYFLPLLKD